VSKRDMNINGIQSIQLNQNTGRTTGRDGYGGDPGKSPSSILASGNLTGSQVSAQAILAGINYIEEQLNNLLTSFPPFFPLGTFQRADLIKGIRSIEDQIGKSGGNETLKKIFSDKKLSENASDTEISASLSRLFTVREHIKKANPGPAKPGSLLNVST
jgi:hypothetical protein